MQSQRTWDSEYLVHNHEVKGYGYVTRGFHSSAPKIKPQDVSRYKRPNVHTVEHRLRPDGLSGIIAVHIKLATVGRNKSSR